MNTLAGRVSLVAERRRAPLIACLGVLVVALLSTGVSALWPREPIAAVQKRDPRYASQTGSLAGTRHQAISNANGEAIDHAVETCGAAGLAGLAAKYGMAPDIASVAARYAQDFEASARAARRAGCVTGLREGG